MKNKLRAKPKRGWKDYSVSHLDKGREYHDHFRSRPGRAMMWDLERKALREMLERVGNRRALDFACGTGRVAGFLKEEDPGMDVHGVDISESMLGVAREAFPGIAFRHADGRCVAEELGRGAFGLITAFRFFSNADDELRERSADQISAMLEPGGFLIFNNHRNFWSVSYMLARLAGRGAHGAENGELEPLFTRRGFRVLERRSLGVLPQSEKTSYLLPWSATRLIERANLAAASRWHSLGYNTIWLLQKE